jgi:hypothetical protein
VSLVHCGLSTSEIEAYERDGLIFPIAVLPTARVTALRRAFEELDEGLGATDEPCGGPIFAFPGLMT